MYPMIATCYTDVNSNVLISNCLTELDNQNVTVEEIRLDNLKLLINEFGSAAEVARRSDTAPSYLSQVINRVESRTGKPRDIGTELERKLEAGCGKKRGWMDEDVRSGAIGQEERKFLELMQYMSKDDLQIWFKVGVSFAKFPEKTIDTRRGVTSNDTWVKSRYASQKQEGAKKKGAGK